MEAPKIKIYTRSMNSALYNRAMFFIDLPYPKVRLLNTSAEGYLYALVQDEEADIVINIDEDAFIFDLDKLKNLLNFIIENEYINCGMPDGGVVHLRRMNPLVTNPYFNILNTKEIRKQFKTFREVDYSQHKVEYEQTLPKDLMNGEYKYVYYEPYYPFFIWLGQNFKTLYLNAINHIDGESTTLCDHLNQPFLIHTWYSRFYNRDKFHTKRINNVVLECGKASHNKYKGSLKDTLESNAFYFSAKIKSLAKKIKKALIEN